MDEHEKALRLEALTEMFIGFGQPVVADRLRYYANLTHYIPLGVFKQSCRLAAAGTTGGFPPGPGDIIAAAKKLAPGRRSPSHGRSEPRWLSQSREASRLALAEGKRSD